MKYIKYLFLLFLLPGIVNANGYPLNNYYNVNNVSNNIKMLRDEVNYNINTNDTSLVLDLSNRNGVLDSDGFDFSLLDYFENNLNVIKYDGSNNNYIDGNGKVLFSIDFQTNKITLGDDLSLKDNIYVDIDDKIRDYFSNSIGYDLPANYKNIKLILVKDDYDDVRITSFKLLEQHGGAYIINPLSFSPITLNSDISFLKDGDYVKTEIIVSNPTNEEYLFDEVNNEYVSYTFEYDNEQKNIRPNGDTKVYLTIKYNNESGIVPDEVYNNGIKNDIGIMGVENEIIEGDDAINKVENPNTSSISLITLSIIIIVFGILIITLLFVSKKSKYAPLVLLLMLLIPSTLVHSEAKLKANYHSNVYIRKVDPNLLYINDFEYDIKHIFQEYCVNFGFVVDKDTYIYGKPVLHYTNNDYFEDGIAVRNKSLVTVWYFDDNNVQRGFKFIGHVNKDTTTGDSEVYIYGLEILPGTKLSYTDEQITNLFKNIDSECFIKIFLPHLQLE